MPKMHAISLLSSGALIGTIVGYTIARYGPQLSFVSNRQSVRPGSESRTSNTAANWLDKLRSIFNRSLRAAPTSSCASGNHSFDECREATLQRLRGERRDFEAYLDRLRKAKEKQAFDEFLAERSSKQHE